MSNRLCYRCFRTGHDSTTCLGDPAVACTECWRLNFFTTNCCRRASPLDDDKFHQAFRLCTDFDSTTPRLYIDVDVYEENIVALVSTGQENSCVSTSILAFLQAKGAIENKTRNQWTIRVPIKIRATMLNLICNVTESMSSTARLTLGRDFLIARPSLWKLDHKVLHNFYIKVQICGVDVKALLNTELIRSRISANAVPAIKKLPNHAHNEYKTFQSWRLSTPFLYNDEPFDIICDVIDRNGDVTIELGMDFLFRREFVVRLDNITLNTKRSWVLESANAIEFAYNHPNGSNLARYLRKRQHNFQTKYYRDPLTFPYIPTFDDSDSDGST